MAGGVRKAIATGELYPYDPLELEKIIKNCFIHSEGPGKLPDYVPSGPISCIIVPHGQISHFGPIAAHSYSRIVGTEIDSVILVGPCQKNRQVFSIYPNGYWETPLGSVEVDNEICTKIAADLSEAKLDAEPHLQESSIEVQIPFLQHVLKNKFKIVPICTSQYEPELCDGLSKAISKVTMERRVLVVGISNLTQNQIYAQALRKDALVFDRLAKPITTDMTKLHELMKQKDIQVSGYGPLAVLIGVAKELTANKVEVIKYGTSGQTTGDYSSVTGYCTFAYARSQS